MIRVQHIGTTTIQGPADDMPAPFDPRAHNADRAQIAALGADPLPAARRSPMEHERDAGAMVAVPADLIRQALAVMRECGWHLAPGSDGDGDGILEVAAAEVEDRFAQLAGGMTDWPSVEHSREFARGYEVGRAVGAVEGGE